MTVDEQVGQIQRKLAERTTGAQSPVDRVDNPVWIDAGVAPSRLDHQHDRPGTTDL